LKVPVSWLREYVETTATAHEMARRLSISSLEVDRVIDAVRPIVAQCFADVRDRYGVFDAQLVFDLREVEHAPASLSRGEVSHLTVEDPYLRACLEDATLDAPVDSRETGGARATMMLHFGPPH
jgi:hypothetical protein